MNNGATRLVATTLVTVFSASGCVLLGVKEQREALQRFARIRGHVRTENPSTNPVVVLLARTVGAPEEIDPDTGRRPVVLIDHFPRARSGPFAFAAQPGTFRIAAFEDRNSNLIYDPGEPVLAGLPDFEVAAGGRLDDVELVIPHDASLDITFDVLAEQARTLKDQQNFSMGRFTVLGEVVDLKDSRFGMASGRMGMWRFVDFLFEVGAGVYFLEPYDPSKIPVLFVHGMSGFPQEFSALMETIDRDRFQSWFYFYPSGVHLDGLSSHLTDIVTYLQNKHGFDEMAVVAHSMGGLVARSFLLKYWEQTQRRDIQVFVAISSPWGGSESTAGIENLPEELVVFSLYDMRPTSDFVKGLFRQPPDFKRPRTLPGHTNFHMMYGFKRDERSFGPSGDHVLTLKSMTRIEALKEADYRALPLDYGHVDILKSGEAANRLNAILGESFD